MKTKRMVEGNSRCVLVGSVALENMREQREPSMGKEGRYTQAPDVFPFRLNEA